MDENFQNKLLLDVISENFDDANDLISYVQNRTGKLDSCLITPYWLGQEHMLRDKTALAKYIKFECEHLPLCGTKCGVHEIDSKITQENHLLINLF